VRVIRLIGDGTIEEGMYRMAQEKLKLEEDLGCRSSGTAEEDGDDAKVESKDVFRLLHDYLQLDLPDAEKC
jgi:SNF2 family DNA or RNA helicase